MIYCKNIVDMKPIFYSSRDFETTFFVPFSAMPLSQLLKKNKIIPLFQQWHCRHCLFLFYFKSTPHSGTLGHTGFGQENWAVEFRQCHCRNSKIFSLLLSLFSILLFGWISAMPLPKFSLSSQFPNYLWTVHITQINFEFYNINPKDSSSASVSYFGHNLLLKIPIDSEFMFFERKFNFL